MSGTIQERIKELPAQEGAMALVKSVERFYPGMGNKFLTYAAPPIRNAMLDVIRKLT